MSPAHVPLRDRSETRARRRWLGFIVGLFAFQAVLWSFALSLVANDVSHAVEPDYDRRALAWDEHMKRRQRGAQLGWSASLDVEPPPVGADDGSIHVRLADADERPIADAEVELTVFHQARASERKTITLHGDGRGGYQGAAPLQHEGKWRFELVARRGDDAFFVERVQSLQHRD